VEKTISEIGGYAGLVNAYYSTINNEIDIICSENDYERKSHAFAHWFLMNIRGINEQVIPEMITDGFDDWAIDAVNIDHENDVIELYQFKMPTKEKNIQSEITQDEVLKFFFGYQICSSGKVDKKTNTNLKNKIKEIIDSEIFSYKLIYVSYTSGLGEHARICKDVEIQKIEATGNEIEWTLYDKTRITNLIYSSKRKKQDFEIKISQVGTGLGYVQTDNAKCYSIYVPLNELAKITQEHGEIIFDENVRLFHGITNAYNNGIIKTTLDEPDNFHLYNNGIVVLSDHIRSNDARKTMKIKNPRVVNGCQTMNSLVEAKNKYGELSGFVLVKAIEIVDPIVRQNISIYLNSQTEIKDSYLISNLPIVMHLEEELKNKGYFLERQANQIENIKKSMNKKQLDELLGKGYSKVINLELAIQVYATFFENLGPIAKLNKAKLFNNNKNLEKIFSSLNAEKVMLAYNVYRYIGDVITTYRRYRRNIKKNDILNYLEIEAGQIDDYIFLNTADIFLLSAFSELVSINICPFTDIGKEIDGTVRAKSVDDWIQKVMENLENYTKQSIEYMKESMRKNESNKPPATLTKNATFHNELKSRIRNDKN
jgi:hypothetical protein